MVIIIGLLILFALAGSVFAFYWYVPKAEVTIYLKAKTLEKEMTVSINVDERSVEVDVEKSKATTGIKTVGDQASGTVMVYNKTDLEKTFAAGTSLIGPDDLSFSLSEDVTVASRSAEEEGISFGKAEVAVTADAIGTESNLGGGSKLSFSEYPTSLYSATAESGLSGGTSREILVVSEEDLDNLSSEAEEELKQKAEEKLNDELGDKKKVIGDSLKGEEIEKNFSAEEGEETDQLGLSLKIKYLAYAYDESELEMQIMNEIKDDIPDDFVFDPDETEIETEEIEVVDNQAEFRAVVKVGLLPKIDFAEIKKNLAGRYPDKVDEYLKSLPNFSSADIKVRPNLPAKLKTLPRMAKNIIIETEVEE
jgi:hypothetical protein